MAEKKLILVGAGAEVDFRLPTGENFTLETFYSKKSALYDALSNFYPRDLDDHPKYAKRFLFDSSSTVFLQLCEHLISQGGVEMQKYLPDFNIKRIQKQIANDTALDSVLAKESRAQLYKALICETFDEPATAGPRDNSLRTLLEGSGRLGTSHYGILETYYSSLIHPQQHPIHLWKLINFYWSAFFCIALPFADEIYGESVDYRANRYQFVLNNLAEFCSCLGSCAQQLFNLHPKCYYAKMRKKFDYVATTNYTPFADLIQLKDKTNARAIRLSGSLTRFERLDTLTTFDLKERGSLPERTYVFPFLMCQSPVKPIIELSQIEEYGRMAKALRSVEEVAILGYSFCPEDIHIATMVGQSLHENPRQRCTFFKYAKSASDAEQQVMADEIAESLRLKAPDDRNRLSVRFISEDDTSAFDDYLATLD